MDFKPTNFDIENEYPKLVRDRIPEIIKQRTGVDVPTRVLADDEYLRYLLKKIIEESTEMSHSLEVGNLEEEIADVLEIISAILELKDKTLGDITKIQDEKRQKNGGFKKRILMLRKA